MNLQCLIHGHKPQTIDGRKINLVYQKGDTRQTIDYFNGLYSYCQRDRCGWTKYEGDRRPYARLVMGG